MKKIISSVMLFAAAAMAFSACQKHEMEGVEVEQVSGLTFSSVKPAFDDESKTEWTGTTVQWSDGDKIRIAYTAGGVWQNEDGNATADEEVGSKTAKLYASTAAKAGETATFSVPGSFTLPTGVELKFYGVYPSTASVSESKMLYAPSVTVTIPSEQTPLANSFDNKADLMAATSAATYTISDENPLPSEIPLKWSRLVAHGYFTLKNLAVVGEEDIQSIVLTANEEADMVGSHYLYLDTRTIEKPTSTKNSNILTVEAKNLTITDGNVSFWSCFLPCTWTSVSVQVETDKATYTREIDLSENNKIFVENARNTLGINMATAERVEKVVSVGDLPFVRDFSDFSGTSSLSELDGFVVGGSVYIATGAIRLATGSKDGSITTKLLDLSQNFHVKVTASGWADNELSLLVSSDQQSEIVALTTSGESNFAEYVLNFQPISNAASITFAAKKNVRCYIRKIEILEGHADLPSTLTATAPEQMSADGGAGSFVYTLKNPKDDVQLAAATVATWITNVTIADGTVKYDVQANETEVPREAAITLTYGDLTKEVIISQAGKTPEGEKSATYTVTSASTVSVEGAPEGASVSYSSTYSTKCQLTGGNNMTFTLSGYDGCTIKGITLSMKSNTKGGSGSLSVKSGSNIIASISDAAFNTSAWNGSWSTSYVDVTPAVNQTLVGSGEKVIITIEATANSLYCQSVTVIYTSEPVSGEGGETPDPEEPDQPSSGGGNEESDVKTYTLTIDANSFNTKSYAANDNEKTSTATTTDGSTMEVKWTSYQVMNQSSAMQWKKSVGYIYNSTDLGTITDISITSSAGSFTKYIGASVNPTTSGTGGYFTIKVGSDTGKTSNIVVTFKK